MKFDRTIRRRFKDLKILIIDEISMVSPTVLDTIDKTLKFMRNNQQPFGGVQTILVGDFFQLPAISKTNTSKKYAFQSDAWKNGNIKVCYLDKIFRQKENDPLIKILNDIRAGKDISEIRNALEPRLDVEPDTTVTHLFTHRVDVDKLNKQMLDEIKEEPKKYYRTEEGDKSGLNSIIKNADIPEVLTLKKGALVLFTVNTTLGATAIVNGLAGIVIGFTKYGLPKVQIKGSNQVVTVTPHIWNYYSDDKDDEKSATVEQLPLRLGFAISVHRSQGMTLTEAVIDLSKSFLPGQGYTALTRIKSLNGLYLQGLNDLSLQVDKFILTLDPKIKQASEKTLREFSERI